MLVVQDSELRTTVLDPCCSKVWTKGQWPPHLAMSQKHHAAPQMCFEQQRQRRVFFSNCGPHSSNGRVIWEFVRNAIPWSILELLNQKFWEWSPSINFFFFLFRAAPSAFGRSQARGQIGATAAGHSRSHTRSEPSLGPTPQLRQHRIPDPWSEARD